MDCVVRMETSIWAYPWDLLDEGVETAIDRIASLGLDAVSVAVAYHSGKFISPRNPHRRVYFPKGGVIYFKHSELRFKQMPFQPVRSQLIETTDILGQAEKYCRSKGLKFIAWVVGTHNTRLASSHLDFAARNAFGDPYLYALCPSHEAVRTYLITLVEDLLDHHQFDAIEMESNSHTGFLHGYHHEFYSVDLTPFLQALLALCFCTACERMATEAGIDIGRLKQEVRSAIDLGLDHHSTVPADSLDELFEFIQVREELGLFIRKRCESVTNLVRDLATLTHGRGSKLYCAGPVFAQPTSMGWVEGIDAKEIGREADRFEVSLYFEDNEKKAAEAFSVAGLDLPCEVGAAINAGHPYARSEKELINSAAIAQRAGFASAGFYNYGTLPDHRLGWIAEAVKSLRGLL